MIGLQRYKKTTEDIIKEELKKLSFGGCSTYIYEYPREAEDIDNLTTSRFGITKEGQPIVEFYTSIIDQIYNDQRSFILKKYSSKQKYIQSIIKHEYRHYEQYKYAIDHKISIDYIDEHMDIMEKDAYKYEKGTQSNLDKVFIEVEGK